MYTQISKSKAWAKKKKEEEGEWEEIKYENVKITQRIFNVEKAEAAKGMLAGCVYT